MPCSTDKHDGRGEEAHCGKGKICEYPEHGEMHAAMIVIQPWRDNLTGRRGAVDKPVVRNEQEKRQKENEQWELYSFRRRGCTLLHACEAAYQIVCLIVDA